MNDRNDPILAKPTDAVPSPQRSAADGEAELVAMVRGSQLVPVLCHDLRSPLSSIVTGAGFLQHSLAKLDGMASEKRVVESVLRSAGRLAALITTLHDLAELTSGSVVLDKGRQTAASLVNAAVEASKASAATKEVTLEPSTPNAEAYVECERDRILTALRHLIDNALRYSPKNGTVRVGVEELGATVVFFVSDDGPGMTEERRAHAFDPRWHAAQSPRDGTGLGLALVRGVAVAHGGDARVEGPPGTRVSFWLPASP